MHGKFHLPTGENSDGRTLRDLVPLGGSAFGWGVDKDFDLVLRVLDLDVRLLAKVLGVSLNLRPHGFKLWG